MQSTVPSYEADLRRRCSKIAPTDIPVYSHGQINMKQSSMVREKPKAKVPRAPSTKPKGQAEDEEEQLYDKDFANLSLEQRIGIVLKRRRLEANLTLADLSAGADLSSAMLSRIENGMATASLDALERLAAAVGIGLGDLFKETEAKQASAQLVKRDEQMEVVRVGTKYGHTYRLLAYDRGPTKLFEPFFIQMDKKSETYPRFSHPGTEFIYMLQGRMEYRFGDKTYLVEPGDAFTFSGDVVHGPEKLLDEKIRFLAIIFYHPE